MIGPAPNAPGQAVERKTASVAGHYQDVSAALPKERVTMLYANVARLTPLVSWLGREIENGQAQLAVCGLRPVRAVGLASGPMGAGHVQRAQLFVSILA